MLTLCEEKEKCNPYMCLVDLSKAFDCIERDVVYKNLRKAGIPRKIVRIIRDMHLKTRARYKINGSHTKYINTIQGVPQGDPLSPIIFNLVINPMLTELESKGICYIFRWHDKNSQSIMMYADDFACICETREQLQEAINICKKTIDYFNLRANVKKSAVMQFSSDPETRFGHKVFTWGEGGSELPFVSCDDENCRKCLHTDTCIDKKCKQCKKHDRFYKYLGMKYEPHLNWDLQYKKLIKSRASAYNECLELYKDVYTPPELKLAIYKSKEESVDKYGCEVTSISDTQKTNLDMMQMKHLKNVLMCHPSSRNSVLRLMTGVYTYETIRIMRTIGLLKKINKQPSHRGPLKLMRNWEDLYATWLPNEDGTRTIIDVNVTNDKFGRTNCRRVWTDHWEDIYNMSSSAVKRKWCEQERIALESKLTDDTDLPQGTRDYTPGKYKTDPLIEHLSSIKLSQFLNLVNGGHPLYWGLYDCPWCGEESTACHIIDGCGTRNAADYIKIALNTSAHVDQRVLAAECVISFGAKSRKHYMTSWKLQGGT